MKIRHDERSWLPPRLHGLFAGDGAEDGGGGGSPPPDDFSDLEKDDRVKSYVEKILERETRGLVHNNRALKEEKSQHKEKLETLQEELEGLNAKIADLEKKRKQPSKGKSGVDDDELEERIQAALKEQRDTLEKEKAKSDEGYEIVFTNLEKSMIDGEITRLLAEAGATEEGLNVLPLWAKQGAKLVDKDSKFQVQIFDGDGERVRNTKDYAGKDEPFMNLAGRVAEAKEKFPSMFRGTDQRGTGLQQGNGSAGSLAYNPWAKTNWNVTEQHSFVKQHGMEAAKRAAAQAGLTDITSRHPPDK